MSQSIPYDGIKFHKKGKLQGILSTPDDSENGFPIECDLIYPDKKTKKNKNFSILS